MGQGICCVSRIDEDGQENVQISDGGALRSRSAVFGEVDDPKDQMTLVPSFQDEVKDAKGSACEVAPAPAAQAATIEAAPREVIACASMQSVSSTPRQDAVTPASLARVKPDEAIKAPNANALSAPKESGPPDTLQGQEAVDSTSLAAPQTFHTLPSAGTWVQKLVQPAEVPHRPASSEQPVNGPLQPQAHDKVGAFDKLPSTGTWCQKRVEPQDLSNAVPSSATSAEDPHVSLQSAEPRNFHTLPSTGTLYQLRLKPGTMVQSVLLDALQKPTECTFEKTDFEQPQPFHAPPSTGTWCQKRIEMKQASDAAPAPCEAGYPDKEEPPKPANDSFMLAGHSFTERAENFPKLPSTGTWLQNLPRAVPLQKDSLYLANASVEEVLDKQTDSPSGQNFHKLPSTATWCQKLIEPARVANANSVAARAAQQAEENKENEPQLVSDSVKQTAEKPAENHTLERAPAPSLSDSVAEKEGVADEAAVTPDKKTPKAADKEGNCEIQ